MTTIRQAYQVTADQEKYTVSLTADQIHMLRYSCMNDNIAWNSLSDNTDTTSLNGISNSYRRWSDIHNGLVNALKKAEILCHYGYFL